VDFARNVQEHLATARALMKEEPCLVKDMQVLIDTRGDLYHLDFDRCFKSSGKKFEMSNKLTESCFQNFDAMEDQLYQALFNTTS